jgi:peptidyl-prolyl cis-trans isomerase C
MKPLKAVPILLVAFFYITNLNADDTVFARQGDVVLTQDEMDAAFSRIPEIHRLAFIRSGERVNQLVQSLLRSKQVAKDATAHGFDDDKLVLARLQLAEDKELADAWLQKIVADAPKVDYEALAYERYLAEPENYLTPEMVDVSHILIKSDSRPEQEAFRMAQELREEILADPALFDEYVMEHSEDPAKAVNRGRYPQMQKGQMVRPFEEAAFAMNTPGSISELVQTSYGFHIIRFNGRIEPTVIPFEQIKPEAVLQAEQNYLDNYRRSYLLKLTHEPIELPEGAVDAMVKRHFGENLELAPEFPE